MLNEHDVNWIKANRAEVTEQRTTPVSITQRVQTGYDPFTDDATYSESTVEVPVTWSAATGDDDIKYVNGVEVRAGDFVASFPVDTDLSEVETVEKDGAEFALVEYDRVGLGDDNRIEALLRRVV